MEAGEDDCGFNILSGLGLSLREVVGKLLELTNLVLDVLLFLGLGEIVSLCVSFFRNERKIKMMT